jgi:hypothetical protein
VLTQGDHITWQQGGFHDGLAAGFGLGDLLHVNGKYLMIISVTSPTVMTVDFTDWVTGPIDDYNLYRGHSKTIASGPWNCVGDVVI